MNRALDSPNVALKVRAAVDWCGQAPQRLVIKRISTISGVGESDTFRKSVQE